MDPDEDVELGALVEARRRGAAARAVVAIQMPRDLLARTIEYGQMHGMTMSDVLRTGAERLIDGTADLPAEPE